MTKNYFLACVQTYVLGLCAAGKLDATAATDIMAGAALVSEDCLHITGVGTLAVIYCQWQCGECERPAWLRTVEMK